MLLLYCNVIMEISQQVNKRKFFRRASVRQRLIAGGVLLAVAVPFGIFRLVVTEKIDIERWVEPCGFKQRYSLPCPTCGVTTSVIAFAQGKVFKSFYIQPAGSLLCCVAAVSAFLAFIVTVFGVYFGFLERFFTEVKINLSKLGRKLI